MLHRVEITGFDRSVDVEALANVVRKAAPLQVELGVVMQHSKIFQRPKSARAVPNFRPRNPDWQQILQAQSAGLRLACHASGSKLIEQILRGSAPDLKHPAGLKPFQTLQLNTTSQALPFQSIVGGKPRTFTSYVRFVERLIEHDELKIEQALQKMPSKLELIIQVIVKPGQKEVVPAALLMLAERIIAAGRVARLLLDTSGGRGSTATDLWPKKRTMGSRLERIPIGYTGGLNPSNIKRALDTLAGLLPGERTWCGMETGARKFIPHPSKPDRTISIFDLDAVERFLLQCVEFVGTNEASRC